MQKYNLPVEEYYDLAAIGLCKASMTFDSSKSQFSTYAYKCMYNEVYFEKRKENFLKTIPQHNILYYQAEIENSGGDSFTLEEVTQAKTDVINETITEVMFDEYIKKLSPKKKQILLMLISGYKQREIGKIVGCTQTRASRIKREFVEYMNQ